MRIAIYCPDKVIELKLFSLFKTHPLFKDCIFLYEEEVIDAANPTIMKYLQKIWENFQIVTNCPYIHHFLSKTNHNYHYYLKNINNILEGFNVIVLYNSDIPDDFLTWDNDKKVISFTDESLTDVLNKTIIRLTEDEIQ